MRLASLVMALLGLASGCGNDSSGNDLSTSNDFAVAADDMAAPDDLGRPHRWEQLFPANDPGGPQPRGGFATTWDGKHLLFSGGEASTGFNDFWSFDPVAKMWTQITPNGATSAPAARGYHGIVWTGARLILFGGRATGASFNDVWSWDATNGWALQIADSGNPPARRDGFGMTWNGRFVLVYGGDAGLQDTTLWGYDPIANQWSMVIDGSASPSPGPRGFALLASSGASFSENPDAGTGSGAPGILVGGQYSNTDRNDVWAWTPGSGWAMKIFEGANGSPPDRAFAQLFFDGTNYLMTGGSAPMQLEYNDVWSYSPATNRWTQLLSNNTPGSPKLSGATGAWTGSSILFVLPDSSVWQYTP